MTEMSLDDIVEKVVALRVPLLVVTGGEPMLQLTALLELADDLHEYGVAVHVETNGTRRPPAYASVQHWSISPKLPSANSGRDLDTYIESLAEWSMHPRAIFKVVCATPSQVDEAVALFDRIGARTEQRWVMPQGITHNEVTASLRAIIDHAVVNGCNVSTRTHVHAWGNERGR